MTHIPTVDRRVWMVLYPEDYDDFTFDPDDNLAILLDEEQCREVKRLAEEGIEMCEGGDSDG